MGRALVNKSISSRQRESNFSEIQTNNTLGPELLRAIDNAQALSTNEADVVAVNNWVALTQADQGLLDAIYNFINTNREGLPILPDTINGRNKKLTFSFYGTLGKSLKPAEIGQFDVVFSYPPNNLSQQTLQINTEIL